MMDVWEGLDQVPWETLTHAYGSATDIPDCLRKLRHEDARVRSEAQWMLYGNLYHQGSRYSASAAAIPFLLRLAGDRGQPDRAWLFIYIAHLLTGGLSLSEEPYLCDGERLCLGREVLAWSGSHENPEVMDWLACYRAAEAGISVYLEAAIDARMEVRVAALYVLSCFYTQRAHILPVLRARLVSAERSLPVQLALLFAMGRLGAGAEPEIRARLSDPLPLVRLLAAAAQFYTGPRGSMGRLPMDIGEEVVRALVGVLSGEAIDIPDELPFLKNIEQDASGLLLHLSLENLQSARAALRTALSKCSLFSTITVVQALLMADFSTDPVNQESLTPSQRQTLQALVLHPDVWMVGNLSEEFRAYGIPFDRESVAAWIGEAIPENTWRQVLQSASLYLNDFHDASQALERLMTLLPAHADSAQLWQLLGRALIEDTELSREQRDIILESLSADDCIQWTQVASEEGDASAALQQSLHLDPEAGPTWGALAMLRVEQDHPGAVRAFGRAADLGFRRSMARQNQALLLFDRGEERAAIHLLEREVRAHPEDENCWYHLGLLRCKIGEWPQSMEAMRHALLLDPGRANSWYTRACAAAQLGMRSDALMDVAEALRLEPALAGDIALDDDFASLRMDPGFLMLIQQGQGAVA